MQATFGIILIIVLCFFIWLFVSAMFLLWGASIAGIRNRSWGKAFGTIIIGGIALAVLSLILSPLPGIGHIFSAIGSFLVTALVMMSIFRTTFGKALGATILAWVLSIIVGVVMVVILLALGIAIPIAM